MNYEPNKVDWNIGDFVIHDCDAKTWKYLMLVVDKDGTDYTMIYPFVDIVGYKRNGQPAKGRFIRFYHGTRAELHDPARFDIKIPGSE